MLNSVVPWPLPVTPTFPSTESGDANMEPLFTAVPMKPLVRFLEPAFFWNCCQLCCLFLRASSSSLPLFANLRALTFFRFFNFCSSVSVGKTFRCSGTTNAPLGAATAVCLEDAAAAAPPAVPWEGGAFVAWVVVWAEDDWRSSPLSAAGRSASHSSGTSSRFPYSVNLTRKPRAVGASTTASYHCSSAAYLARHWNPFTQRAGSIVRSPDRTRTIPGSIASTFP
mmetsp:Transcript_25572/g.74635  ORF Transcript_25572/g.74635 Transcript_25572/m.74635 type:complete len:225 (+) Transcript_25572:204-878(+)